MHIVIVINSINRGGAGRHACELASYLVKQSHRVSLIPVNGITTHGNYAVDRRVDLRHLDRAPVDGKPQGLLGRLQNFVRMRRLLKQLGADIVIANLPYGILLALVGVLGSSTSVIACERNYPPKRISTDKNLFRRIALHVFYRVVVNQADVISAQTEAAVDWLQSMASDTPVVLIPNAVSQSILDFDLPRSYLARNVILYAGRLIPQKRVDLLVEAFLEVCSSDQDWRLVLIGDGPDADRLAALIPEKLESKVMFLGHQNDIAEWYYCAEIFVLPSEVEGFPNVLLEAMALKTACIAFDIESGPREILRNGKAGVLLPNNLHKERLVKAIQGLMESSEQRELFKREGLYVRWAFGQDRTYRTWLRLVESVLAK